MSINVYHSTNFRDTSFYGHDDIITADAIRQMLKDGKYDFVATVNVDDLNVAYGLTNNIMSSWTQNENVDARVDEARSTSVGDIFVTEDVMYIVAAHGFDKLAA